MKHKLFGIICFLLLISAVCVGLLSVGATSDDPADNYTVQTAPNEDSSISMWFDYSFRKTFTSDTTATGMNTFSIYMAKNEIESAQFVLYSDTTHSKMKAEVTDFTDANGNSVTAEIYYEMYVTTANLDRGAVLGMSAENSIIREGETPDPVVPLANFGAFQLNAGKSQAFLIRAKTTSDSVSGWYSAQLNILDANGNVVKTATVYLYVWDFEISEKTVFQTALYTDCNMNYGGNYEVFYNYLLDNRLNAMDIPGGTPSASNAYLLNDRVNAVRITHNGAGSVNSTGYMDSVASYASYPAIYERLRKSPNWEKFKDKLYFYTVDEPMPNEQQDALAYYFGGGNSGQTYQDVISCSSALKGYWPEDVQTVVPIHQNGVYPSYTHFSPITDENYNDYELKDGVQAIMDVDAATIFCPQLYAFTPSSYLYDVGYSGSPVNGICNLDGIVSGMWSTKLSNGLYNWYAGYYNFSRMYGDYSERMKSYLADRNANGKNYKLWAYRAGGDSIYTYAHHLIESPGIQTKLLFWQCFQEGVSGYLYYDTNGWEDYGPVDTTVTGAKTTCNWMTGKHNYADGTSIYGLGVLFYGSSMGKIKGLNVIGSLRVEIMRDGVEEYQMLSMLSDLKGNDTAQNIVSEVSDNVVQYVALNNFDRSAWSSDMDSYDIVEAVRRQLGNAVEAATVEGACDHVWGEGTVTKEATCITTGDMQYTCSLCGVTKTEIIPNLHEDGSTFTCISSVDATCTTDGEAIYRCNVCGFRKTVTTKSFHTDSENWVTVYKTDTLHSVKCPSCGKVISDEAHKFLLRITDPTCTQDGSSRTECSCGIVKDENILPATGHSFENGICTKCGEAEFVVVYGDIDGNGKVNSADLNTLTKYMTGTLSIGEAGEAAADVTGDGKVNSADSNTLLKYIAGVISKFPAEK